MASRDYLIRQIEQLTSVLGKILGLKREQKPKHALLTIDEFLKRTYGMSTKLLDSLPEQELLRMCDTQTLEGRDKLYTLAILLKEEGELQRMLGNEELADKRRLKSLQLLLTYADLPDDEAASTTEAIDELLQAYDESGRLLPMELAARVWRYYGRAGQFAKAEDELFRLLQQADKAKDARIVQWAAEGLEFYRNLLKLEDEQLSRGNLPRDEVHDAIQELHERYNSGDNSRAADSRNRTP